MLSKNFKSIDEDKTIPKFDDKNFKKWKVYFEAHLTRRNRADLGLEEPPALPTSDVVDGNGVTDAI